MEPTTRSLVLLGLGPSHGTLALALAHATGLLVLVKTTGEPRDLPCPS